MSDYDDKAVLEVDEDFDIDSIENPRKKIVDEFGVSLEDDFEDVDDFFMGGGDDDNY